MLWCTFGSSLVPTVACYPPDSNLFIWTNPELLSTEPMEWYAAEHYDVIKCKKFLLYWALCEGIPPVTIGYPSQRTATQSFHVFFDLLLNKRFSKQSRRWQFEMPSCTLLCHCNGFCQESRDWFIKIVLKVNFCRVSVILGEFELAYWGWDQMVIILQTTFWNNFLWRFYVWIQNSVKFLTKAPKWQHWFR